MTTPTQALARAERAVRVLHPDFRLVPAGNGYRRIATRNGVQPFPFPFPFPLHEVIRYCRYLLIQSAPRNQYDLGGSYARA